MYDFVYQKGNTSLSNMFYHVKIKHQEDINKAIESGTPVESLFLELHDSKDSMTEKELEKPKDSLFLESTDSINSKVGKNATTPEASIESSVLHSTNSKNSNVKNELDYDLINLNFL